MQQDNVKQFSQWVNLPPNALETIYSFLNREERSRMSVVCKKWYHQCGFSSLWRTMTLVLPLISSADETAPEIKCALNYGHRFHHVKSVILYVPNDLLEETGIHLHRFLAALISGAKLLSFSFINLQNYLRKLTHRGYQLCLSMIELFLLSQSRLTSIKIVNSKLGKTEAMRLFQIICRQNCSTLKYLVLKRFLASTPSDDVITLDSINGYVACKTLMNLKYLDIDYSEILENFITCFENADSLVFPKRQGSIKIMNIFCEGWRNVSYQGIPPAAWKCLKKYSPALEIDFKFQADDMLHENCHLIEVFLVRHMPITSLTYTGDRFHRPLNDVQIGSLFEYLVSCDIHLCLERLEITWTQSTSNFADELISFPQKCPELDVLDLYIQHPALFLDRVFSFWLENGRSSLEYVFITVSNVRSEEHLNYYSLLEKQYAPSLSVQGLYLSFNMDALDEEEKEENGLWIRLVV